MSTTVSTPFSTRVTAQRMAVFINAFRETVIQSGGPDVVKALQGGGFIPGPDPFPSEWDRPKNYRYLKYLIEEIKKADEPRILQLEPLCDIPEGEVRRVGEKHKALMKTYEAYKAEVRSWRKHYFKRVEGVWKDYEAMYNERSEEEWVFIISALEEADAKDSSFSFE